MPLYKTNFPNLLLKNHLLRVITVIFLLFSQSYAQKSLPKLSLENIDTLAFKKYLNKEFRWFYVNIDKKFVLKKAYLYDGRCIHIKQNRKGINEYNTLRLLYCLDTINYTITMQFDTLMKIHFNEKKWYKKRCNMFANSPLYKNLESLKVSNMFIIGGKRGFFMYKK